MYCRWVEVIKLGGGEAGGHCSYGTPNGPWSQAWRFQVYCVQHPVLVTINRQTEEDGALRLKLTAVRPAGNPGAEVDMAQTSESVILTIKKAVAII